jgi:hypothetical protein
MKKLDENVSPLIPAAASVSPGIDNGQSMTIPIMSSSQKPSNNVDDYLYKIGELLIDEKDVNKLKKVIEILST